MISYIDHSTIISESEAMGISVRYNDDLSFLYGIDIYAFETIKDMHLYSLVGSVKEEEHVVKFVLDIKKQKERTRQFWQEKHKKFQNNRK